MTGAGLNVAARTIAPGSWAALALILVAALVLRLDGLGFGLPALLDPDEPIFVLTSLRLLREHTLNPGWFGHPGTTTIYALAVIEAATYGFWHLTGRFADPQAFAQAVYADPSLIFMPARIFILACGIATILLAYLIARRLFGERVALLTAMLLAVDPLHIRYSQIIRTDMHSTVFILLEILAAIAIARSGRRRDYLLAALCLGFACATKWPAAACAAAVASAALWRAYHHPAERRAIAVNLILYGGASILALFVASPYLLLDYPTVLDNLHGEERPFHLGATGYGFLGNLWWYSRGPFFAALGAVGLVLAGIGYWLGARRSSAFGVIVIPVALAFLVLISAQALVWERWVVPLLPLMSIAAAVALDALLRTMRSRLGPVLGGTAQLAAIGATLVPIALTGAAQARERATDTRRLATAWARSHIPAGSTVTIEHLAFDVLDRPWHLLYPLGDLGCVDARAMLKGQIPYSAVAKWRRARPVVDLGSAEPSRLESCRGDWAITVNWDRYRAESGRFGAELANYERLVDGGRIVATFTPVAGQSGGPVVRIVRLRQADGAGPR